MKNQIKEISKVLNEIMAYGFPTMEEVNNDYVLSNVYLEIYGLHKAFVKTGFCEAISTKKSFVIDYNNINKLKELISNFNDNSINEDIECSISLLKGAFYMLDNNFAEIGELLENIMRFGFPTETILNNNEHLYNVYADISDMREYLIVIGGICGKEIDWFTITDKTTEEEKLAWEEKCKENLLASEELLKQFVIDYESLNKLRILINNCYIPTEYDKYGIVNYVAELKNSFAELN